MGLLDNAETQVLLLCGTSQAELLSNAADSVIESYSTRSSQVPTTRFRFAGALACNLVGNADV